MSSKYEPTARWITNEEREQLLSQSQERCQAYRREQYVKQRQEAKRSALYAPRTNIVSMGAFNR